MQNKYKKSAKQCHLRADILAAEPFAFLFQAALGLLGLLLHLALSLQLSHVTEVGHHPVLESKKALITHFILSQGTKMFLFVHTLDGIAGLLEPGGAFEPVGTLL